MSKLLGEPQTQCPSHVRNQRASKRLIKSGITTCVRVTNAQAHNQYYPALFVPIVRCSLTTMPSGNMYKRHIQIRQTRDSRKRLEPWLLPQSFPGINPGFPPFFHSNSIHTFFEVPSNISQDQAEMILPPNPTKTLLRLRLTQCQRPPLLRAQRVIVHPKRPPWQP